MRFSRLHSLLLEYTEEETADLNALRNPPSGMLQVYLWPYNTGKFRCVHLSQIWVKKEAPKGTGTAWMEELCRVADKHGWIITLELGNKGGGDTDGVYKKTTSQGRLQRFYSRFGFKKNATKGMFMLRGTRHRMPRGKNILGESVSNTETLYHVTYTKLIPAIRKEGIRNMNTSNWSKGDKGKRYGQGQVYAFTDLHDATRWALKMDWEFHQNMGSGNISIIRFQSTDGGWEDDPAQENSPLDSSGHKGQWLRRFPTVEPQDITGIVAVTKENFRQLMAEDNSAFQ